MTRPLTELVLYIKSSIKCSWFSVIKDLMSLSTGCSSSEIYFGLIRWAAVSYCSDHQRNSRCLIKWIAPVLWAIFRELTLSSRTLKGILSFSWYFNFKSRLLKESAFHVIVINLTYSQSMKKLINWQKREPKHHSLTLI